MLVFNLVLDAFEQVGQGASCCRAHVVVVPLVLIVRPHVLVVRCVIGLFRCLYENGMLVYPFLVITVVETHGFRAECCHRGLLPHLDECTLLESVLNYSLASFCEGTITIRRHNCLCHFL